MTSYNAVLAEAFREHRDTLYRIAIARLRGAGLESDAEDVVSTAVLSLMDHPVSAVTNWRALLIDVVEKKVVDHIRSAWSRRRDGREPKPDEVQDDRFDIANAEDEIDVLRAIQVATDALNALPEPHQTVARECMWRGCSQNAVATALGISQPRVSQVLKEAKDMIAAKIEESGVTG